jgi:hypothetical protein
MDAIKKDRGQLTVLYLELRRARQATNIMKSHIGPFVDVDRLNIWHEVELDIIPNSDMSMELDQAPKTAPAGNSLGPPAIEDYLIPLPSNGNVDLCHRNLELTLQSSCAEHHLARIRELIAKKSFQYSHVMRVSPRKGTTTRSWALVKKLNTEIALHSRLYAHCQACLILLGGDQSRFKVLAPDNVKASTTIINPNESGSTRLKLFWIWEASGGHRFGLASASASADASGIECLFCFTSLLLKYLTLLVVRHVHWLRARAQLMRWQEEVTLITYEMHWAVRFFAQKSQIWANAGDKSGLPVKAGHAAYADRQNDMWKQIAFRANHTLSYINSAYKSPL